MEGSGGEALEFEWDPAKSASNLEKHGIDFQQAVALWDDPMSVTGPAKADVEDRFMTVARLGEKTWSAVHTLRDGRIRIISVRRSRFHEIAGYEAGIYERTRKR
jgi:uncharacterized DUF497 family protein